MDIDFIYPYSHTVSHLKSSDIRDLMKYAIHPGFISFAGGMPNNHLFPVDETEEIYHNLPEDIKESAFQYGPTTGMPALREAVKKYMKTKGISFDTHDVLITTGSLQGIYIISELFLNPGDTVLAELPSFVGALTLFKSFQARIEAVPMDDNGIKPEALKQAYEKNPHAKFLYVIPNFHNPAGLIYNKERRKFLLDFIKEKQLILLEDDPYNELFFDNETETLTKPVLGTADTKTARQIIYAGTFSKILAPGFRLGWLILPKEIMNKAEIIKQSLDACSPNFSQVIAEAFMRQGYMHKYLEKIRPEYKIRRDLVLEAVEKYFPSCAKYVKPKGGFYLWIELPEDISATKVLDYAIKNGVVFVSGKSFAPDDSLTNAFRIAYSNVDLHQIDRGIKVIGEGIREAMKTA